ncbi:MAG: hydrolase [Bacteroidales bacterium]|nr:hydrolase [Bacteroidales bacterium]
MIPTRQDAFILLKKYNQNDRLIKHALSVEAVMRHFAKLNGEDEEKWGIIGLIHDLDYEQYPEQHCTMTRHIMEEEGWPEEYIRAVVSHGWGICSDTEPQHPMEKVLFTIDELTGLITAAVLVRPSKSIMDLTVKSVNKKWKVKTFAAGANREIIAKGAEMMGKDISYIIQETIVGMQTVANNIGLAGE